MKIQLDYDNKLISIQDNVNLGELAKKIQNLIPDWKDWTLETGTFINWTIPQIPNPPKPDFPPPYVGDPSIGGDSTRNLIDLEWSIEKNSSLVQMDV